MIKSGIAHAVHLAHMRNTFIFGVDFNIDNGIINPSQNKQKM